MRVIVTMAGEGARLQDYCEIPKPMITVKDQTILEHSLDTLIDFDSGLEYIFVIRDSHEKSYKISSFIRSICLERKLNFKVFVVTNTEGQADTLAQVLEVYYDQPFLVLNADNYMDIDPKLFYEHTSLADIILTVFEDTKRSGKWCYLSNNTLYEKHCPPVDSAKALAGLFYFQSASAYLEAFKSVRESGGRISNEYYISTVINKIISKESCNVKTIMLTGMVSLGTEDEIKEFLHE